MSKNGFDYKKFVKSMCEQAKYVPAIDVIEKFKELLKTKKNLSFPLLPKHSWETGLFDEYEKAEIFEKINIVMSYIILVCAIIFWVMPQPKTVMLIVVSVLLFAYLLKNWYTARKIKKLLTELEEIRQKMQDFVDPLKMYERLGIDVLSIHVGAGLLSIVDPDQDGKLMYELVALRQRLTDNLGYIIPNVRIMDCSSIDEYEYIISVRGNVVAKGIVYPERFMVIAQQWDEKVGTLPDDVIIGVDPVDKTTCYWLTADDINKTEDITITNPSGVIIKHLEEICIEQVDKILTIDDIENYLLLAKSQSSQYVSIIDNIVLKNLTHLDIQKVFANLIREKVSIKDILRICEDLANCSQDTKCPDVISEKIREDFKRQICLSHCNKEDEVLYTIKLSQKWETLYSEGEQEFVEATAIKLIEMNKKIGFNPVVVCSSAIRLPLYQLLVRHIPTVVVMSCSELDTGIKVENIATIGED